MRLLIVGAMALALVACSSGAPPAAKARASAKSDVASQVAAVRAAGVNGNELEVQPLRDPQVEDLRMQAEAHEARRELKQANATLDRALALTPGDPDLLQWKAELALLGRPGSPPNSWPTIRSRRVRSWAACAAATGPRLPTPARVAATRPAPRSRAARWLPARWRRRSACRWTTWRERTRAALAEGGPLDVGLEGYAPRAAQAQLAQAIAEAMDSRSHPGRRSRHRHRQDLRLPGAGAAVGPARDHLHRHARAAGPALPPRPAARARGAGRGPAHGAAQGPRQLSVPVPHGAGQGREVRHARRGGAVRARGRLGRPHDARRPGRAGRPARGFTAAGRWSRPPRKTAWAASARSGASASWPRRASRRRRPTWWS